MEIDLRGGTSLRSGGSGLRDDARGRNPFAGGLLTLMVVPTDCTLQQALAALQERGVRAWTENLPAPVDETVLVAAMPCEQAPSLDAIGEVSRHLLAVLQAAGVEVDVRGSGYVSAEALERWGAHSPA